jgi:hypothetical protein
VAVFLSHRRNNADSVEPDRTTSQSCECQLSQQDENHRTNQNIDDGIIAVHEATPFVFLFSVALLISYQQPIAVEHIKSATESSTSVTTQTINSAITAIRDEESTTRNKWFTLEAWKTIIHHYYDLDDQLGFSLNTLTRAVRLFGSATDSKVRQGNTTGVHLRTQAFVKRNKYGKKLVTDRFRFLLLTDSTAEPKEPADVSGWKHLYKNSKAVIDKTSPLFLGIRALPSFKDRAVVPGSLNGADLKISQMRKKVIAPKMPPMMRQVEEMPLLPLPLSRQATGTALKPGASSNLDPRNPSRNVSSAESICSTLSSMTHRATKNPAKLLLACMKEEEASAGS